MPFSLEIQNFGKLAHATIEIGNLTVFAGPNNTGKSHVSKLLYSLFDAMNANHALVHFRDLSRPVNRRIGDLQSSILNRNSRQSFQIITDTTSPLSLLIGDIRRMENFIVTHISEKGEDELLNLDSFSHKLIEIADAMRERCIALEPYITESLNQNEDQHIEKSQIAWSNVFESIAGLKSTVNKMHESISNTSFVDLVLHGMKSKIYENLLRNYQIESLEELKGLRETPPSASISGIGDFQFGIDGIEFEIARWGLKQLQEYSKVVYLESPLYWKLSPALETGSPRFYYPDRINLGGVPEHFFDLLRALKSKFSGKIDFPELFENLTNILGGKLILSETGELLFSEAGKHFSMHMTASGVANLGMLALLIERKVLDKGTFLFIDEPEAHLHTAWQVVMAETLFELARQGVNVVIATHSVDILKWIEVRTKQHPEDKQLIALNHFTPNGVESGEEDFEVKLAGIKKGLTEPFMNLHLKGLGL